ncbi:hypothetical protein [Candidatus Frankia alpina]|uniref:hypothetical protein n=1 Tax=Candidatus Frankia alpina TaxID=2699483 RepID=UPI001386B634|nr:hypothetical protein [Candidatus Frankia alpina]
MGPGRPPTRASAPFFLPGEEETADEDLVGDDKEGAEVGPMQEINPARVDSNVD